ncbi:hypothetical protein [Nibricoccus sp. IMCC34717]|uniref:hypothetical protein n=1 Tax=Nibricoccus sp. IMCC34717 TaxID=3034021 RepID=UPI00384B386D
MTRAAQSYSSEVRRALAADDELTYREACRMAGIGPKDCASNSRRIPHVRAREVVVWLLLRAGWTQERVGGVTKRTARQIKRIAKKMGVMSPFMVT